MAMLDGAAVSYQAILTKADKLSDAALNVVQAAVAAEVAGHPAAHPQVLATSARSGAGIADLRAALASLAAPERTG
jgi:GTP-binding protein